MKRPLFIIIGIVIVFILVLVWLYLLFFSTPPENGDSVFSNFGFGDTTDTSVSVQDGTNNGVADTVVDVTSRERLRQLTTGPVLAYREVSTGTSTPPDVYYVEAGTGHIYSINSETGETTRLSATTIPVASKAALSPNGQFVMLRSGDTRAGEFVVGSLATSSEKINTTSLDENIVDFVIPNNEEVLYGVQQLSSYVGKRYSLRTGEITTLFTIPFREAAISWGGSSDATHYAYPKATKHLEGFVYKISGTSLERLPINGYGLSAIGAGDTVLFSHMVTTRTTQDYVSQGYIPESGVSSVPISVIPEKCTATPLAKFICAAPLNLQTNSTLPDSWYMGETVTADYLWEVTPSLGSVKSILNLTAESGRELDVVNITTNTFSTKLYFQDRHSKFLWLYELTTAE